MVYEGFNVKNVEDIVKLNGQNNYIGFAGSSIDLSNMSILDSFIYIIS